MLTETEARELLATAAATIEISPGQPVALTARTRVRRWLPAVAAAVAVILVATGAALLLDDPSRSRPSVSNPPDTTATLQGGRIPSVVAYPGDDAAELLASLGLVVTTKPSHSCGESGRADRTQPGAGTRFEPGDPVTLFVTQPSPTDFCVAPYKADLAWQLLDFANGWGPSPWFAPELVVYVNGERTVVSEAEATDVSTWSAGSALGILADAIRQDAVGQGGSGTPQLSTRLVGADDSACGGYRLPSELGGRQSLRMSIAVPTDGIAGPCTLGNVYQSDGQIDAIVVRTGNEIAPPVGGSAFDPDPDSIAAHFVAFAKGESDSLPIDTPVRLYLGGYYIKTIEAADATDRSAWVVCPRTMSMQCDLSALTTLRAFGSRPAVTDFLPTGCLTGRSAKSPTDTGGSHMVVLGVPEPETCSDERLIQIWFNDVSQITAVNLLYGTR